MHAEMTDSTIIELAQDCTCITHAGPHWLHMDAFSLQKNREILAQADAIIASKPDASRAMQSPALLNLFAKLEAIRLDDKSREMTARQIKRIIQPGEPLEPSPDVSVPTSEPKPVIEKPTPETPYQRREDGHPLFFSSDRTWQPVDQIALAEYGLIPAAIDGLYQDGRPCHEGWAKPVRLIGWAHSGTFNRWTAFVEFEDGYQVWTYPKTC